MYEIWSVFNCINTLTNDVAEHVQKQCHDTSIEIYENDTHSHSHAHTCFDSIQRHIKNMKKAKLLKEINRQIRFFENWPAVQ